MAPRKGKTYRTSSGKQVDFGALLLANETVPAVGNMSVNARGDEIASDGSITKSREQVMREYNELNTMVPQDDAIPETAPSNAAVVDDDWTDWEPPEYVAPKKEKAKAMVVEESTPQQESESQGQAVEKAIVDSEVEPEPIPEVSPPEPQLVVDGHGDVHEVEIDSFNNKAQKHEEQVEELAEALEDAATQLETSVEEPKDDGPKSLGRQIEQQVQAENDKKVPTGGLAAAVAAAKRVETKVEPMRGEEDLKRDGVRRI